MKCRNTVVCLPVLAALVLSISACDISGPEPVTITLYSDASLDGRVSWDSNDGDGDPVYSFDAAGGAVDVGDIGNDTGFTKAYVSFDFSGIPADAYITHAVLRLFQTAASSGVSYGDVVGLGAVLVDNVSYSDLTATDLLFNASTTGSDIGAGPLASFFSADSWHELDVLDSAKDELAEYHNGKVQFRIYHNFGNDNDLVADTDGWAMGEDAAHRPELVVTYTE